MLHQLNPDASYGFLGGETPKQVIQELGQYKISITQPIRSFDALRPSLTDDEIANYYERWKIYGQTQAMKWAIQQHSSGNP
jgi:hypothetical protein